jgi:hypothetical protein
MQTAYVRLMDGLDVSDTDTLLDAAMRYRGVLSAILRLLARIERAAVFSPNEQLGDVNTASLKYVLCAFYAGLVMLGTPERDPHRRHKLLQHAQRYLMQFIERCKTLGMLDTQQSKAFDESAAALDSDNSSAADSKSSVVRMQTPAVRRAEKIAQFKREQALQAVLAAVLERRNKLKKRQQQPDEEEEDEVERAYWLALINASIAEALKQLRMLPSEFELVAFGMKQRAHMTEVKQQSQSQQSQKGGKGQTQEQQQQQRMPRSGPPTVYHIKDKAQAQRPIPQRMQQLMQHVIPPSVTKQAQEATLARQLRQMGVTPTGSAIQQQQQGSGNSNGSANVMLSSSAIDRMVNSRANARSEVFRQFNPHTVSLEQWAMDMQASGELPTAQQSATAIAAAAAQKLDDNPPSDNDDEDIEAVSDAATYKARAWDNWTDDNEKGIGNTMK